MTRKSIQRSETKKQNKSTRSAHCVGQFDAGLSQSELERRVKRLEDWVASQMGQKIFESSGTQRRPGSPTRQKNAAPKQSLELNWIPDAMSWFAS